MKAKSKLFEMLLLVGPHYLNFSGETKVSDLEKFVFCNEHITAGQITMNNVQTSQVLLQGGMGREGERDRGER